MSFPSELIPTEGWLGDYIAYARAHVMAPDHFHLACGLAALSAVCGSSQMLSLGHRWHFATTWSVLVGPSGFARKSSAMNVALDIIDDAVEVEMRLPKDFSREAFWDAVASNPAGVLELDEFGGFLQRMGRDYMAGIKQDLSGMWDSPRKLRRKLRSKEFVVDRPRLTILGGCPTEDLVAFTKLGDLKQGLSSRFMFFVMTPDEQPGYIGMVPRDEAQLSHLSTYLRELGKDCQGMVEISARANARFEELDRDAQARAATSPPELSGWVSRRGIWTLKLAALFSIAATEKPAIDPDELDRADWLLRILDERLQELVAGIPLSGDRYAERRNATRDRALAIAAADSGVCTRRDLMRKVQSWYDKVADLDQAMKVLEAAGRAVPGVLLPERGTKRAPAWWFPETHKSHERFVPGGYADTSGG